MKKLMNYHEWLGTGIQLMVFTLLFPFLAILLGFLPFPDGAKEQFTQAALSFVPLSHYVEGVVHGINTSQPGLGILDYAYKALQIVYSNVEAFMYVGMWLYLFRVIFSEILVRSTPFGKIVPIFSGVPIFQVTLGLFFSAFTYGIFGTGMDMYIVVGFLALANIILTCVFVKKPLWRKLLDMFCNLGLQSYLASLTAAYVIVLLFCFRGVYTNVAQAATAVVTVTLLWIVYLGTQYLLADK